MFSKKFFSAIGTLGGFATVRRHGTLYMSKIGSRGGKAVSKDRKHMSEIGRVGGRMAQMYRRRANNLVNV